VVGLTEIEAVVAEVLQLYVLAPLAVKVVAAPRQITVGVAATTTVGTGLASRVTVAVEVQPPGFVPVTVYTVSVVGLTTAVLAVWPELQLYEPAPVAVRVTLEPEHTSVFVGGLIATVGSVLTVSVLLTVFVQPPSVLVAVTV
jgi:hypothetical protein